MYYRDITNWEELKNLLKKCEKRKGKKCSLSNCKEGDLFRLSNSNDILLISEARDNEFVIERAWELLYPIKCCNTVNNEKAKKIEVYRLTKENELFKPIFKPDLVTTVLFNLDGSVCCQNYLFGLKGQHFKFRTKEDFEKFREKEQKEKGNIRIWEYIEGSCSCNTVPNQIG